MKKSIAHTALSGSLGVVVYFLIRVVVGLLSDNGDISDYCWRLSKTSTQFDFLSGGMLAIALKVSIQPLVEELVFRKMIIDRLSKHSYWIGVLVSTLVFTAMHYQFWYTVVDLRSLKSIAVLGVCLAICYSARKSVFDSFIVHFTYNGLILLPKETEYCVSLSPINLVGCAGILIGIFYCGIYCLKRGSESLVSG